MNCNCNPCDPCKKSCKSVCGCPEPVFAVDTVADQVSVLRFNVNGVTSIFDFGPLVFNTQTDTSLSLDQLGRTLNFNAERHIDTLSAQELGSIFHLADIGDVSAKNAQSGSLLVYNKDNNCGDGCFGLSNGWRVWNALDTTNVKNSVSYLTGTNADGIPVTLGQPANPNQTYLLGWNANNQVSYFQPTEAPTPPASGYQLYLDSNNNLIKVKI